MMRKYRCVNDSQKLGWFTENEVYDENFIGDNGMNWSKQRGVMNVDEVEKWVHGEEHCGYKFEEVKEMFGKKDLESGMKVEMQDGTEFIVIGKWLQGIKHNWTILDNFNENLTNDTIETCDIIKAYKPLERNSIALFFGEQIKGRERDWELIWQRENTELQQAKEELKKAEESLRKAREKVERLGE